MTAAGQSFSVKDNGLSTPLMNSVIACSEVLFIFLTLGNRSGDF